MDSRPEAWRMHGENAPCFAEYLLLAGAGGWGELVKTDTISIGCSDALVVLGMQNDYLPVDSWNPDGGAIATREGQAIVPLVVELMEHFAKEGGTVVVTRDFHPAGHCSFIDSYGPLPTNCVQGTAGSHIYRPVAEAAQKLRQSRFTADQCEIMFKGFHDDIDSPSAFEYPEGCHGTNQSPVRRPSEDLFGGSSLNAWTGACLMTSSNSKADVNAAPDALAVQKRIALADFLKKRSVRRIFICGLSMFNVVDTAVMASKAGFVDVFLILDASRAGHLAGLGEVGSGFLHDPAEFTPSLVESRVNLIPTVAILQSLAVVNPVTLSAGIKAGFPSKLGPFSLKQSKKIGLYVDREAFTYRVVAPLAEIRNLESHKISPGGVIARPMPLTLDAAARSATGLPSSASSFAFAYPLGEGSFKDGARAYFATMSPSAAFFVYGGFIYFDKLGRVVSVNALALGSGLNCSEPQQWPHQLTTALESRWCCVTMPFIREKGARLFAWINPGERLQPVLGGDKLDLGGEHGAFVYLFHEDLHKKDERDCIFSVISESIEADADAANIGRCPYEEGEEVLRQLRGELGEDSGKATLAVTNVFKTWDKDKSGCISKEELSIALKTLDPDMSLEAIEKMFDAADSNKNGAIEFEELVKWIFES